MPGLLAAVAALALASPAAACPGVCTAPGTNGIFGTSVVVQANASNGAVVTQNGPTDISGVYQGGASNQASVDQGGILVLSTSFVPSSPSVSAARVSVLEPLAGSDGDRLVEMADEGSDADAPVTLARPCRHARLPRAEAASDNTALHLCDDTPRRILADQVMATGGGPEADAATVAEISGETAPLQGAGRPK